jgi:membrane-associated protein
MELLATLLAALHDPEKLKELIVTGSYPVLFGIVFAETGLLVGFFLPGDSLLVTAGILAGQGYLDLSLLMILLSVAAIVGDTTGYAIGKKTGPMIFKRPKSLLFNPEHLHRAHRFYEKYGGKTIVIARFVPVVRTFAPVVAGVGEMEYKRFLAFNVFGGIGWIVSMSATGYFLGSIPGVDKYLHLIILTVIFLSILPAIIEFWREHRKRKKLGSRGAADPGQD